VYKGVFFLNIGENDMEGHMFYGCYYLTPNICRDIIITAGMSGIHTSKAVKKMRNNILNVDDIVKDAIPALKNINYSMLTEYAGEFAECLVEAAGIGKGIEIAIGYPKVLVFKVN
jgi:hypothetical protein